MKKLNLFLLVAGFFVFSSCTERLEHNEEKSSGNVVINLSSVNAERGAVPDGYSSVDISKVTEWKLTFSLVPPFDKFPAEVRIINDNTTGSVTIGVGQYDLLVEGSYTEPRDNGEFTYNLRGTRSGIVIKEGEEKTVSVLVGSKKTTEGKGRFSAEMSFMQGELNTYYEKVGISSNDTTDTTEKSKRFKAELVSRKTGEIVYSTHSGGNLLVAEADSGNTSVAVKSAQTESERYKISSGYYYFRFYADFATANQNAPSAEITPDWKEVSIGDNLVEIGDGLSTSWPPLSYSDSKSLSLPNDATKYYYYASDDGSKENNGISQDAPGELYAVLDTIYNNPMVQNAEIDYSYTNNIRFDVSKIRSGKTVEIKCKKNGEEDASTFVLEADSSMYFQNLMESITLTSTGGAKGVKIKEGSSAFVNSGNAQKAGISLEKGVYLDLTSLTADSMAKVNLRLDVDDIEYYKKNPVFVSGVSLLENKAINNSEYGDIIRFAGDGQFNFIFAEKKISSERFEYFADSPVVGVMYSHEEGYPYRFALYNATFDSTPVSIFENIGVSAWCSDENGNIYAAAFDVVGDADKKTSTAPYFIKYEKQVKGASFSFEKKTLGDYKVENLPASMCTDGKSIWYVNSAAKINQADTSDSFSLFDAGSWVSSDSRVYKVSIENPATQEPLDFSALFNNGKVTAVYYCDGALYVAGFKSELQAKCKWAGYGENAESEHEIYNRTFSVYKLKEPDNVASAVSLSDVSAEYDVYTDASELERQGLGDVRVRSYSSITDMAVVGGKVYVIENTYMSKQSGNEYPTEIVTGTLRNITDNKIYTEYTYQDWDSSYNKVEKKADFVLPGKILAVVPKKLKLVVCDSEQGKNYYYNVDLNNADNVLIERKDTGSAYYFDSFPTSSALIGKPIFDNNSVYIKQSSKDALVSK